jgi:CRP-like cAMP-binding protein
MLCTSHSDQFSVMELCHTSTTMALNKKFDMKDYSILSRADLQKILDNIPWKIYKKDEVILKEGSKKACLFYLTTGYLFVIITFNQCYIRKVNVVKNNVAVGEFGPGSLFGLITFLLSEASLCTIVAMEQCQVYTLNYPYINLLLERKMNVHSGLYQRFFHYIAATLTTRYLELQTFSMV